MLEIPFCWDLTETRRTGKKWHLASGARPQGAAVQVAAGAGARGAGGGRRVRAEHCSSPRQPREPQTGARARRRAAGADAGEQPARGPRRRLGRAPCLSPPSAMDKPVLCALGPRGSRALPVFAAHARPRSCGAPRAPRGSRGGRSCGADSCSGVQLQSLEPESAFRSS